ncbi:PDZ domain-containing protein 9-like isoform X2 [Mustelus asterias]
MKENPEHNLGPSLRTFITKDVHGLGLVLIKHGSFLQILRIIGDSSGDSNKAANLKPGDILVKIGNKNVLGYSLREMRHLVGGIPMGTELQLTVYRNYKDLPDNWKMQTESIHSNESIQFSSEEGEADRSSSSDEEDKDEQSRVKFKNFRPLSLFWHDAGTYIPPISRAWHAPKKNQTVLLIGPHVECDIVFHKAFDDEVVSNDEEEVPNLDTLWSVQSDTPSSTSSSSSSTNSHWVHQPSSTDNKSPLGKSSHWGTSPHPEKPNELKSLEVQKNGKEGEITESTTETTTLESFGSSSTESLMQNSQSISLNTSTQFTDTGSGTSTSTEDQTESSSSDTIVEKTRCLPGKRVSLYHFKE